MQIGIVIFDDFTDLDLFLPWDLLNRARVDFDEKNWQVQILGTQASHTSRSGLVIQTTGVIDRCHEMDAVVIASGPGVRLLLEDSAYLKRLSLRPDMQLIAALCSGALLLGKLGYLKDKRATTYPTAMETLEQFGAQVVTERFVQNGNIATAAACLAAQDVVHWIISTLRGRDLADKVLGTVQQLS